jgi:hypothetical protein
MSEKDFLSRWSRLKRRAQEATPETPELPDPPPEAPEAETPAAFDPDVPIPELPPLDSLTAASDFKPFLQAGVPDSLKAAALRRLWSIDPEIRDFVGPARDYGWDWNTPGGVPGSGPLPSAERIAKLVEQIFGVPEDPRTKDIMAAQAAAKPTPEQPPSAPGAVQPRSAGMPLSEPEEQQLGQQRDSQTDQKGAAKSSRPRHGSATPS